MQVGHKDNRAQNWRFLHHSKERLFWKDIVASVELIPKRRLRFMSCGRNAAVWISRSTEQTKLVSFDCGSRFCPHCRIRRSRITAEKIAATLTPFVKNGFKLMTFTLKASEEPLAAQLRFLVASFRRLRQQVIWTKNVHWGRAVIEITYNHRSGQWHPHLHVVARAGFITQKYLALAWADASSGSMIVDIRIVKRAAEVAGYLTEYLTKPSAMGGKLLPPLKAAELYLAVRNRKMMIKFGDAPDLPKISELGIEKEDPGDWEWFAELDSVLWLANHGDVDAIRLLRSLRKEPP